MSDEDNILDTPDSDAVVEATRSDDSPKSSEKNGAEDKGTSTDIKKSAGDTFDSNYVKKIREEAKSHRTKAQDLEKRLEEAQKQIDTLGKTTLEKANRLNTAIEKRLINAEINKICHEVGIVDPEAFKMMDMSQVKVSDDGEVVGLDKIVEDIKAKKPYLIQVASSGNPHAKAPAESSGSQEKPTYSTPEEFEKAAASLLNQFS